MAIPATVLGLGLGLLGFANSFPPLVVGLAALVLGLAVSAAPMLRTGAGPQSGPSAAGAFRAARRNPWRFALAPGATVAALEVIACVIALRGDVANCVVDGLFFGAVGYGLAVLAGYAVRARRGSAS